MWQNAKYNKDLNGVVAFISAQKDNWNYCILINENDINYQEIMALVAEGKLTIAPAD